MSVASIKPWLKRRRETGKVEPKPNPGPPVKEGSSFEQGLPSQLRTNPDFTLEVHRELFEETYGISVSTSSAIRCNLFDGSLGQEKAVDVQLATDLIMFRNIYDTAVLVSGDQDYVPAVKVAKDSGKRIINVAFKTRGGKLLPGAARRLNQITDWSLDISYKDLAIHLNI